MQTLLYLTIQLIPDFIIGAAVVIIGHWVWLFGFQGKPSGAVTTHYSKKGYQTGSTATGAESSHFVTRPDLPAPGIPGYGASATNGMSAGLPTPSPPASNQLANDPGSSSVSEPEPPLLPRSMPHPVVRQPEEEPAGEVAMDAYQKHFEESERVLREKERLTPPTKCTGTLESQPNEEQFALLTTILPKPEKPGLEELPLHQTLLSLGTGSLAPAAISQLEKLATLTVETQKRLSYPMEPSLPRQLELADYLNAFPCLPN